MEVERNEPSKEFRGSDERSLLTMQRKSRVYNLFSPDLAEAIRGKEIFGTLNAEGSWHQGQVPIPNGRKQFALDNALRNLETAGGVRGRIALVEDVSYTEQSGEVICRLQATIYR